MNTRNKTVTGNPHVDDALELDWNEKERLIEATLAVAYEQRTANILALMAQTGSPTLRQVYRDQAMVRMGMEVGDD